YLSGPKGRKPVAAPKTIANQQVSAEGARHRDDHVPALAGLPCCRQLPRPYGRGYLLTALKRLCLGISGARMKGIR
ncbi:MAG TPA: hypothetical protein VIG62_04370, partial [Blastocatellia bacterium]